MSRDYTPKNIDSGFQIQYEINVERKNIEKGIDKQLSRVNNKNNSMKQSLDMGGYSLINFNYLGNIDNSGKADKDYVRTEDLKVVDYITERNNIFAIDIQVKTTKLSLNLNKLLDKAVYNYNSLIAYIEELTNAEIPLYGYNTLGCAKRALLTEEIATNLNTFSLLNPRDIKASIKMNQEHRYNIGDIIITDEQTGENNPHLIKGNTVYNGTIGYSTLVQKALKNYRISGEINQVFDRVLRNSENNIFFCKSIRVEDKLSFPSVNINYELIDNGVDIKIRKSTDNYLTYTDIAIMTESLSQIKSFGMCYDGKNLILCVYDKTFYMFDIETESFITVPTTLPLMAGCYSLHYNTNKKLFVIQVVNTDKSISFYTTYNGVTYKEESNIPTMVLTETSYYYIDQKVNGLGGSNYYNGYYYFTFTFRNIVTDIIHYSVYRLHENDLSFWYNMEEMADELPVNLLDPPALPFSPAFCINEDSGKMFIIVAATASQLEICYSEDGINFLSKYYGHTNESSNNLNGSYGMISCGGASFIVTGGLHDGNRYSITKDLFSYDLYNNRLQNTDETVNCLYTGSVVVNYTQTDIVFNTCSSLIGSSTTKTCEISQGFFDYNFKTPLIKELEIDNLKTFIYAKNKYYDEFGYAVYY